MKEDKRRQNQANQYGDGKETPGIGSGDGAHGRSEIAKRNHETVHSIISIIRGRHESAPESAKRPTAGNEPREFTSRGEGGRVPSFIEKLRFIHAPREKPEKPENSEDLEVRTDLVLRGSAPNPRLKGESQ